jgi:hypothetical protein
MSKISVQIIGIVFLFSLAYASIRYHVFESIPSKDFALFIFNKVISLAGFILLAINFALGPAKKAGVDVPDGWLDSRKEIGIVAFMMILVHVLLALLAFGSGAYYGKFFAPDGSINAIGSWSMLFGVLAFVWLWLYNISFKTKQEGDEAFLALITSVGSLRVVGFLAVGHLAIMGFKGWMTPENWAGGMPPITLIAIAGYLVCLFFNLKGRRS